MLVDLLVRADIINVSSQAGSFLGASAAFVVGVLVSFVVSQFTPGKTDEELSGLTWATSTREQRGQGAVAAEDAGWYQESRDHGHGRAHPHPGPLHHLVVSEMSDRTDAPYKPPLSAILLDLRSVIGLLFVVYGIVLTILGIIGETERSWPRPAASP